MIQPLFLILFLNTLLSFNNLNQIPSSQEISNHLHHHKQDLDFRTQHKLSFHHTWDSLLQLHVTDQGKVNYKGFKKDIKYLNAYLKVLEKNIPNDQWAKPKKIAYWMNTYNAYTIKLIINNYPLKSIKDIDKPWDDRFIKIGSNLYTLNDIEHKILRKMNDPRIHFGINCASKSCPKLHHIAFTEENIDTTLEKLTSDFINNPSQNTLGTDRIIISKIFQWFSKDFKKKGGVTDFIKQYSNSKIRRKAKKSFKKYNWNLNE